MVESDYYNVAHEHCMMDNQCYTHTLCNNYYFATATMLARMRLSVTLHAHRLSFSSNFITEFPVYILFLSSVI